ncbi:hypothetical protein [Vibrio campbellii]|uniref:hypothetical protein n=1 Tax=Vibrio campbellii TaxID=680 RepID=UPI004055FF20
MNYVNEIQQILDQIVLDSARNQWGDTEWTREIKSRLCLFGKDKRYWVYATSEHADGSEWLYDVTWLTFSGDRLLNTELVLECEWDVNGIDFDFQKLLLAKSEIKVMIFQQKSAIAAQAKIEDLIEQVIKYSKTTSNEMYLFSCWLQDECEFYHIKHRT